MEPEPYLVIIIQDGKLKEVFRCSKFEHAVTRGVVCAAAYAAMTTGDINEVIIAEETLTKIRTYTSIDGCYNITIVPPNVDNEALCA